MKKPLSTPEKETGEQLDYRFDFTNWLKVAGGAADTIATYTITIDGPDATLINVLDVRDTPQTVRVWLKGGATKKKYRVTCKVNTANSPPRVGIEHFDLVIV